MSRAQVNGPRDEMYLKRPVPVRCTNGRCTCSHKLSKIQWSNDSLVKPLRNRNSQKVSHLSFSLLLLVVCCHHASESKVESTWSFDMLLSSYSSVILNTKIAELVEIQWSSSSSSSIWSYLSSAFKIVSSAKEELLAPANGFTLMVQGTGMQVTLNGQDLNLQDLTAHGQSMPVPPSCQERFVWISGLVPQ